MPRRDTIGHIPGFVISLAGANVNNITFENNDNCFSKINQVNIREKKR
jgi:hypothetical protein